MTLHPSSVPGSKRRGTIRIFIELLVFFLLIAATAFGLRPLQLDLLRKMEALRDSFIGKAERTLGRRIEYESLGPSFFKSIDLRRVRIAEADGAALVSIDRLKFEYSLFDLLLGKGAGAFRGLVLDRPAFRFDAARDADTLELIRSLISSSDTSGASGASIPALPADARVRVRGGSFEVLNGKDDFSAENVSADLFTRAGRYSFSARAGLSYKGSRLPAPFDSVKTSLRLDGEASSDMKRFSCTVKLPRLETPVASLANQSIALSYAQGAWDVRKTQDRIPLDFRLSWSPSTGKLSCLLAMEDFEPRRLVDFSGAWSSYRPWLGSRLSGRASVEVSGREAAYSFDLSGIANAAAPVSRARFDLSGTGDLGGVELKSASVSTDAGALSFTGSIGFSPLKPEGTLSVSRFKVSEGSSLNGDFHVTTEGSSIALFSDSFLFGGLRLDALDLRITPEEQAIGFSASALRFEDFGEADNAADIRLGRITLDGSYSLGNPFLQASVTLDSFSGKDIMIVLAPLFKGSSPPAPLSSLIDRVSLTTEVFLTTDFTGLSFNVPRLVAAFRGDADAFSVMSISGTKNSLSVRDANVFWKGGSAGGSLSLDFSDLKDIAFKAQALYRETNYSIEGLFLDGRNLSFRGEYGLSGNVIVSEATGLSGTVSVESLPLPISGMRFFASASMAFRYAAADAWSAELSRFSVEETGGILNRTIRLALEADADQNGASLASISLDDTVGRLSGSGNLDWRNGFSRLSASVNLLDPVGAERCDAELRLEDGNVVVRANAAGLRAEHFAPKATKMRATGEVRARWRDESDYEGDIKLSELRTEIDGAEYRLSGSGRMTPDAIDLENVALSFKAGLAKLERLSVDRKTASSNLSGAFRGFFAGRETETSVTATASFVPFADWSKAPSSLGKVSARLLVDRTRYGGISLDPFELAFSKDGGSVSLDGGPQNSVRVRFDQDGAFFAALSAPSPIRGNIVGTLAGGMIDARAGGLYVDFPALWSLVDIPVVQFTGGIATGSLSISGPVSDPDFFGSAAASGFRAVVPAWVAEEIGPVSADVVFDGKEFSFGPVPVSVQKGRGTLRGRFTFDRWVPFDFSLLIDILKDAPIPVKADVAGIVARGFASGGLEIANSSDGLSIAGKLAVQNTSLTIDAAELAATSGQAFSPTAVTVDLTLVTGKKVEFVWPSSELPVLRGYADTGDSLAISFDGLTGRYALQGDIDLRGGEVFYFMRSFYLRSGAIKFNENQLKMDPRLALVAEIRDRNDDGPVTVSLVVDEAPLSSFRARFESSPPLSQAEIFGLLGQNLSGQDGVGGAAQSRESFITATSDALAQFNVVRVFERDVRDFTGLDMFSVRTQLIQNAFFGATGLLASPVDRNVGLGNYFDNTTVYMGKFLGSDVFLQGLVSVQVDQTKSTNLLGGLTLEPEFGVEWKTPLFMLRWNFAPNGDDVDKLFINDHSFTITWRKAF